MKKILALVLALCMIFALVSCNDTPENPDVTVRATVMKGPTGMGMSKLMKDDANGTSQNDYEFTVAASPDEARNALISGTTDIAALPVNLAAVLYNKGVDISFVGINTLGVLYILENGNTITSVEDLRGKTIYATGQGSTPQYILEYLLTKNGIDLENDITIEYIAEHAELATKLATGDAAIGILPEPNVTSALSAATQNGNTALRIALDVTEEWEKFGEGELCQGCIVVTNQFKNEHPEQYAKFLKEYAASAEYVVTEVDEASKIIEEFGIIPKAPLAKKAIPNANICFIDGDDGIAYMQSVLNVLYTANPSSVGGKLPDDAFYGKK
ncbi:MAG: ABC transporter substrate-binding protein [Clostridia bacterium]|nr:ABC transporter substrate-binding protein [Clostridia bacterium]MBQ8419760.1 ABC transporter substrate-binding protein [Clostridia bacterium]